MVRLESIVDVRLTPSVDELFGRSDDAEDRLSVSALTDPSITEHRRAGDPVDWRFVVAAGRLTTTLNHRYDPFGRSTTTDAGAQVVEQNAYDGYDRLVRQQKFDSAGTALFTKLHTFDPFDRVTSQAEKVGTAQSITTRYTFVGLADQIAIEERKDTAGAFKVTKSYAYGAAGENLSLVDTPINTTTSKKSFYGTNPHSDVETLTDATGQTTSTYRYTAYGQPDKIGTTGEDAITGNPNQDADIVNPYRFNSKRINGATGTYDMGFREYNPSLNRFLSRDFYDGALKDMALGSDPWNSNRYAFAGGNPISRIELDGHYDIEEGGARIAAESEKWYKIWNARHDTAVALDKDAIESQPTYTGGSVTTSRKENFIRGGSSINPGDENGYADIIEWGPVQAGGGPRTVRVWEVKHGGGQAEKTAKAQVDNYVRALQAQLGDDFLVEPGYVVPGTRSGPNRSRPTEIITVISKVEERGVELYDYGDGDPYSVRSRRLPSADESEERDEHRFELEPKAVAGAIVVGGAIGLAAFNPVTLLTAGSLW